MNVSQSITRAAAAGPGRRCKGDARRCRRQILPDSRSKLSMRPNLFSRPSMYLALDAYGKLSSAGPACGQQRVAGIRKDVPLGRIALLLDLGEDAVGFVIDAMRASRKLAVALDLLLSAHVAGLVTNGTQLAIAIPPHPPSHPAERREIGTNSLLQFSSSWPRSHRRGTPRGRQTSAPSTPAAAGGAASPGLDSHQISGEVDSSVGEPPPAASGSRRAYDPLQRCPALCSDMFIASRYRSSSSRRRLSVVGCRFCWPEVAGSELDRYVSGVGSEIGRCKKRRV